MVGYEAVVFVMVRETLVVVSRWSSGSLLSDPARFISGEVSLEIVEEVVLPVVKSVGRNKVEGLDVVRVRRSHFRNRCNIKQST